MTLIEILYSVQSFFMERGITRELSLNQFNLYLKMANDELYRTKVGFLKESEGAETREQISDALRKFTWKTGQIGPIGNDYITIPDNYRHRISAYTMSEGDTYSLDIVTAEEFIERCSNPITKPTNDHPIGMISEAIVEGDYYMTISPAGLTIYLIYIRAPNDPVLALKLENGIMVYDSDNSTELEWDSEYHIDIIRLILKYLGVPETDLVTFSKIEQSEQN